MSDSIGEREQVIIGTAGHIDHGKTALVKALTGIDADTLAEEKRRGITIELGFVFLEEPGFDKQIVFIDVPGHEKLVRTMVAGASNIDAALLVIAADDGISAQTREHFEILQLLGIETGIVALTKVDLVDPERVERVTRQIRDFVAGTFMSRGPIIPVSSLQGRGVEEIRSALLSVARGVKRRQDTGTFRMPIDRVFAMHGFGTVIAGTVLSGRVSVGDRIEICPEGILARVRGIQIHNQNTPQSYIGKRTAINLQDVRKDDLRRGQCAAVPGSLSPTVRLDARLFLLKSAGKELRTRSRLRLHIGTDEVICRLVLLGRETLPPGEDGLVQLVLESPTVAVPGDRFIIRTFSPIRTIGGGSILDAAPQRHKRTDSSVLEGLEKLEGPLPDVVEQTVWNAGVEPQGVGDLANRIGVGEGDVRQAVEDLHGAGKLVKMAPGVGAAGGSGVAERYLHAKFYDDLTAKLVGFIEDYFARHPYKLLMPMADLQAQFSKIADKQTFETIIADLLGHGRIYRKDSRIGLAGREIGLSAEEQRLAERMERIFREAGFAPPLEEDVRKEVDADAKAFGNVMHSLIERERLVRLSEKVTYHTEFVEAAKETVAKYIREKGSVTVAELRDRLGVSRKYALALLEYFDTIGFTRREGDQRVMK